jgi:hypothetical protein
MAQIKDLIKAAWVKMCKYDGIEPDSLFICLSEDNPYKAEHDKWQRLYFTGLRETRKTQ